MASTVSRSLRASTLRGTASKPKFAAPSRTLRYGSTMSALSTPFRPTSSLLFQHTQRQEIATPILIGAGLVGAGLMANLLMKPKSGVDGPSSSKWIKGGFNSKMDKKEAAQVLGLRETALTKAKVKEAHRRMMIANHPDRGGAPYLASSKSRDERSVQHNLLTPLHSLRNQRSKRSARQNGVPLITAHNDIPCSTSHTAKSLGGYWI